MYQAASSLVEATLSWLDYLQVQEVAAHYR